MFWIAALLLTLIVAATLAWPMLGRSAALPARASYDVEVYDAQLRELGDDLERGVVPSAEAANARSEIARRLLRASAEAQNHTPRATRPASRLAVIPILLVIVAAVPLYLAIGIPTAPDQPLTTRLTVDPAIADLPTLIAQAEARLRTNPNDGLGWDALAPIYVRVGRAEDAVKATENALRLLGSTPERQVRLGSAAMQAASGEVTDAAERAFRAALQQDPENGAARFFLAVRLWQQNRVADAATAWQAIVDRGPEDAAWMEPSRRALAEARLGRAAASAPGAARARRGPDAEDVAAASALPEADRSAMVAGMVSQLAERLKSAPNDPDGWKRLMRSYSVLGDGAAAADAHAKAQGVFAAGSAERRSIDEFAETLGIGGEKAGR